MSTNKFRVTYFLEGEEFTETMSEGQLSNFEKRIERGAEEQILEVVLVDQIQTKMSEKGGF